MKKSTLLTGLKKATLLTATAAMLVSCGSDDDGGSGGGSTSTYGLYDSPYISAQGFINALNSVDGASYPYDNYMVKDQYDTLRDDEDFFVYYDSAYDEYVAVSLDYLRTIQYWDYYSSNNNLADSFRDIQDDDEFLTGLIGDGFGDDYEIVDYYGSDPYTGEDFYIGFDSDELYEDEEQVQDTGLLAKEKINKELFTEASKYSTALKIGPKAALSLATFKHEVDRMVKNAQNGELIEADKTALVSNIEHFTGATMEDFKKAKEDSHFREQLVDRIAAKVETNDPSVIETEILPIFNVEL